MGATKGYTHPMCAERREQIVQAAVVGLDADSIASRFEIGICRVQQICRASGHLFPRRKIYRKIHRSQGRKKLTAEQWQQKRDARPAYKQALALWLAGESYDEIGALLRVSRQRAQQYIRPDAAILERLQARANNLCEHCGAPETFNRHHAHHKARIFPHNDLSNLEYLCKACHKAADHMSTLVYSVA